MTYKFSNNMQSVTGLATREIFKLLSKPEIISFAGGLPANECLPTEAVARISNELLTSAEGKAILQYGTTEGIATLRTELVKYATSEGLKATDSELMVLSGGQQGIDLFIKAFCNKGDVVLVENPTFLAFLQVANSYGVRCIGVKSDDKGLDITDLEAKIKEHKPKALYVVPTFSNPTGKTYTAECRKAICEVTAKYGIMVLEDDPYSRLRWTGDRVPPLKAFDNTGNVVYVTSFSKLISPGLRVGFCIGEQEVIRKMTIGKQCADLHTSNLSQAIVREFLRGGLLEPHIKIALPIYQKRAKTMLDCLAEYMPKTFEYTKPEGGLFVWGEFKDKTNTVQKFEQAIANNVAYIQGQVFYADSGGLNTLRLNFSNADPEKIKQGVKALGKVFGK